MSVLDDDTIVDLLRQAWAESQAGTTDAHEEGGFILESPDGSLTVERWPQGSQNQIVVPPHPGGNRGNRIIVATFHTHPNQEPDFQQEPSLTDIRAVRNDPDLSRVEYEGEYVISRDAIYQVRRDGTVATVAGTRAMFRTS